MIELIEKGVFTPQEQIYLEDQATFQEAFLEKGLGCPQFEGKVERGNVDATNFWINHIPQVIDHYSFKQTVAVFSYLSDLSRNELRAHGFNGLTDGNDKDIQILRKALLKKMLSFHFPSQQEEWNQTIYMYFFEHLFDQSVGFLKTDSFRKKITNQVLKTTLIFASILT
ncbi:MAG TPA: hypothetical protein VJB63_02045 [Patescibacteria group bacterium]|nr:hypothetical protein [Patescibacteria group bacterium]